MELDILFIQWMFVKWLISHLNGALLKQKNIIARLNGFFKSLYISPFQETVSNYCRSLGTFTSLEKRGDRFFPPQTPGILYFSSNTSRSYDEMRTQHWVRIYYIFTVSSSYVYVCCGITWNNINILKGIE